MLRCAGDGAHGGIEIGSSQTGHLGLGNLSRLLRDLAHLLGVRTLEPDGIPAAFFSRIDAGGVLVMKVKERSDTR